MSDWQSCWSLTLLKNEKLESLSDPPDLVLFLISSPEVVEESFGVTSDVDVARVIRFSDVKFQSFEFVSSFVSFLAVYDIESEDESMRPPSPGAEIVLFIESPGFRCAIALEGASDTLRLIGVSMLAFLVLPRRFRVVSDGFSSGRDSSSRL